MGGLGGQVGASDTSRRTSGFIFLTLTECQLGCVMLSIDETRAIRRAFVSFIVV